MFNTVCTNRNRCSKPRIQAKMRHDGCDNIICTETATWGPADTNARQFCQRCKTQLETIGRIADYINNANTCMASDCTTPNNGKKLRYGARWTKSATHCKPCADKIDFVIVGSSPICEMLDDNDQYICRSQTKIKVGDHYYCATHAEIMHDRTNASVVNTRPICSINGCENHVVRNGHCQTHDPTNTPRTSGMCFKCPYGKRASFKKKNDEGGAKYCKTCKDAMGSPDEFESINPKCVGCSNTRPSWAYGPNAPPTRCETCTPKDDPNWISVNTGRSIVEQSRRNQLIKSKGGCQAEECDVKSPSFGVLWKQPTHCKQHKGDGMSDVVSIKCKVDDCEKFRSYGVEWRKPTHCQKHGLSLGYVNVISKRCVDCKIIASYGTEWQKPTHCMSHGQPLGMTNVVSPSCAIVDCKIRPTFGKFGGSPSHCASHGKSIGLEDVVHVKCFEQTCNKRACFGTPQ